MKRTGLILGTALLALTAISCSDDNNIDFNPPLLNANLDWYGNNRNALDQIIEDNGITSPNYDAANPPVAVFDFDNTCIKNDIGDMTTFWMINHNLIRQPADKDWNNVSPLLSDVAKTALKTACDSQGDAGALMTTDQSSAQSRACANEIVSVYYDAVTTGGDDAFIQGDDDFIEPAYAFTVQLQAGYTPEEIRQIGIAARDFALSNAIDAVQTVGDNVDGFNAYIRRYQQIENLISTFQNHGFDVWVVSASSQYIVEPFAGQFGVNADHVIGVRATLDDNGKLQSSFQGAGNFTDGNYNLITFRDGKRYWINKVIFGASEADQVKSTSEITDRLVFVAGDSNTDLSMLKDAEHKLVINRNKTELMCNAYYNDGGNGNWLINPMFISPKGKLDGGYDCDEFGIPDQEDTVF